MIADVADVGADWAGASVLIVGIIMYGAYRIVRLIKGHED